MRRALAPWVAPVLVGLVGAYATTPVLVVVAGEDCAVHDAFGAPEVGVIGGELSWWPPGWDCSAQRHDGGVVRVEEAWTLGGVI